MRFFDELTYPEIAKKLKTNDSTCRSIVRRSIIQIKKDLNVSEN